jgi:serine/threonine protein kinase
VTCLSSNRANAAAEARSASYTGASREDIKELFIRHVSVLAANEHPGTLRLIGLQVSRDPTRELVIVTELTENGALSEIIKRARQGPVPEWDSTKKPISIFGIAAAMAYLHSQGIIHHGLNSMNILLTGSYEPVVANFDFATHHSTQLESSVGIPLCVAPELIQREKSSFPVDVYAFAVIIYRWVQNSLRYLAIFACCEDSGLWS